MFIAENGGGSSISNIITEITKESTITQETIVPHRMILQEFEELQAAEIKEGTIIEVSRLPNPDTVELLNQQGISLEVNPNLPFNREFTLQKALTEEEYQNYMHYWYGDDPDRPFAYTVEEAEKIRKAEIVKGGVDAFFEGMAAPFVWAGKTITKGATAILGGAFSGIGEGLKDVIGTDFGKKLIIIALIGLAGVIGFFILKSFIGAKITKKVSGGK